MKIMICGKGGCGKSTIAVLLSKAFQKKGYRVLIVDADESNIGIGTIDRHRGQGFPPGSTRR